MRPSAVNEWQWIVIIGIGQDAPQQSGHVVAEEQTSLAVFGVSVQWLIGDEKCRASPRESEKTSA